MTSSVKIIYYCLKLSKIEALKMLDLEKEIINDIILIVPVGTGNKSSIPYYRYSQRLSKNLGQPLMIDVNTHL